ncbi:ATPase, T2SS/T4P/T4SS family [Methanotorris igneus]|uniref:Transcriptional regulator, XRE family n=1 Tax=Methanotorris igneus (strain DSM 5666 / JCM 11834 / Kol 5) TaxID=880724 RepID=F6BDW2_METIK|nr:ATPase, T2SS/T4P/T4SS family [Methanotorris igneus]AEF96673.1 transcriptional regulator, XRE family [Methanotorris igneus Kol 5]
MGLLDRIQKKSVKTTAEPETKKEMERKETIKDAEPKTIESKITPKINLSKDASEIILDTYRVAIGDIEMDVFIKKKGSMIYYEISELDKIKQALSKLTEDHIKTIKSDISERLFTQLEQIKEYLTNFADRRNITFNKDELDCLAKYFYLLIGRLGLLEVPLNDPRLEEVMVNGWNLPAFVFHRKYQMCETNIVLDEGELTRIIENIAYLANRTIDARTPMLDAFLPDGSRVNATTQDVTLNGATLTIRKFTKDPLTITDLIKFGTFDLETAAFLWQAVEGYFGAKPANTLIVGGTGSGKTTTLNVLSMFAMYTDRIITIEDTPELQIPHKHVIRMITRPPRPGVPGYEITMDDLIKNALRMRPDRILVGEVRGKEAHSLLVAMNTGHDGALHYDANIMLNNGMEKIGEFCEAFFDGNIETYKNHEYVDISDENITIKSLNKKSLKCEKKRILRVWRTKYNGYLYKIKTEDGGEIVATNDHPFYTLNGIIYEKNAEFLKCGDFIAVPTNGTDELEKFENTGKILRDIREHLNMNPSELEEITGINSETIKQYENSSVISKDDLRTLVENIKEKYSEKLKSNYYNKSKKLNERLDSLVTSRKLNHLLALCNDITWKRVVSIEKVKYDGYVYDLTVEDNHTYMAGNTGMFYVSNCSGTLHANSADEAILRLISPPMNVPKIMITSLNFIINQQRIRRNKKTVRRILDIVEIVSGDGVQISKTTLFEYDGITDSLIKKGICMWEEEVCEIAGITRDELMDDRINRKKVLKYMVDNNIHKLEDVAPIIMAYQEDPEKLLRSLHL